ncbi:hypothetical protein Tco_0449175 [Tanacetum coccineum]
MPSTTFSATKLVVLCLRSLIATMHMFLDIAVTISWQLDQNKYRVVLWVSDTTTDELIEKESFQVGPFSILRKMLLATQKMLPSPEMSWPKMLSMLVYVVFVEQVVEQYVLVQLEANAINGSKRHGKMPTNSAFCQKATTTFRDYM